MVDERSESVGGHIISTAEHVLALHEARRGPDNVASDVTRRGLLGSQSRTSI